MLSFNTIKDSVVAIGAPSTAIMVTFLVFELGWLPIETVPVKAAKAAERAAGQADEALISLDKAVKQHRYQMQQTREQTDDLLSALREVCFNTSRSPERQRACGNLVRHSSPPTEGDSSVAR